MTRILRPEVRGGASHDTNRVTSDGVRLVVQGILVTYTVTAWLVALHSAGGHREAHELGMAAHVARDGSLALPLVLVMVGWAQRRVVPGAERAAASALAAVVALAVGGPVHDLIFASEEADAGAGGLTAHVARDGAVAMSVAVPLMLVLSVRIARSRGRGIAAALVASALMAPIVPVGPRGAGAESGPGKDGTSGGGGISVATDPGSPCPTTAPVRNFDVTALDVNIPLNRFGDHDPAGKMYVLSDRIDAVVGQESAQTVSLGLQGDAIQPLVLRVNEGDCVRIRFTNRATGGDYGMHIDGLAFAAGSSGDAVGYNAPSSVAKGSTATYVYYVPNDPALEGAHYIHPGPGNRDAVGHGLFGALVVEPPGSTYWDPSTSGRALLSGWEAIVRPASGAAFREAVILFHELGNESTFPFDRKGDKLPQVDPHTDAYRPGARLLNYRSEPFMRRLDGPGTSALQESQGYGSYAFGDPPTPMPRSYLGDPMKFRVMHAGSELFHVFHLHGGGIRWRFNPQADPTYDYADTGLRKHPVAQSASARLDSQAIGPGESYDMEIEGGAGGVQQGAGEFLFHCHIAHHYVSGMWSFWRVFNTRQPALAPLPDRPAPPDPVDSAGLVGRTYNGVTITAANLDAWVRPQLPPQGVRTDPNDATVWDWTVASTSTGTKANGKGSTAPVYLGEPEDLSAWPNYPNAVAGHPTAYPGDTFVGSRPKIMFNPINGRPAWPLLRPHVGRRPPFSPNGHSGAPYLGEQGDKAADGSPNPWLGRPDGICPAGAPVRRFNVTAIELPIRVTRKGGTDPTGMIFVLSKNVGRVRAGSMPAEPLAIRANVGDCIAVTLTSEQTDAAQANGYAKVNMHIHHVQFDTQASDGVISGFSFEQSIRPYKVEDAQLASPVAVGGVELKLTRVSPKLRKGVWIAVGQGTDGIEIRQVDAVNASRKTVTLTAPLGTAHATGEWAGTEFAQYRWYADVELDNIFWHDHVDGIHTWGHGLVGQLVIEPPGSTYHDPVTGAEVDSGTIVDVHTSSALVPGIVDGSFRELALWTIDENPVTDSTLNLRAEPWSDRGGDAANRFSSWVHGDPFTPLPRAYVGDPFVIRTINVGPSVDGLHVDGHQFLVENRYPLGAGGEIEGAPRDTIHYGISERFTVALIGGAGGPGGHAGDYLYMNTIGRRFRQGAWGLIRVLGGRVPDLRPLPDRVAPGTGWVPPSTVSVAPPSPSGPGDPCPSAAPRHRFEVAAVDVPSASGLGANGVRAAFVPLVDAAAVQQGSRSPGPLVLHAAAGECVVLALTNMRNGPRVSLHAGELERDVASSGVNAGFNPENTVAPGSTRDYVLFPRIASTRSVLLSDFGGDDSGTVGLYGVLNVALSGSTFTHPVTGEPVDQGAAVDVQVPWAQLAYRDFTAVVAENDEEIGQNHMPYPTAVDGPALVNYRSVAVQRRRIDANTFSSYVWGDPPTPVFRGYAGDPTLVHLLVAPGSEQVHSLSLGGHSWLVEPDVHGASAVQTSGLAPWELLDAWLLGGLGHGLPGDFFYGDLRRPFTEAGMWGLLRSLEDPTCPIRPLAGRGCGGPGP